LLALVEVFHGCIEGIQCPNVERCQCGGQRQDDQEYERA
jgi:hypothetical protein